MESILLITKDALCKDYLPIYGNKYWEGKTPNIDELAENGTVFLRHYTAAPSTVMAFRAMVTGKFAHEQPYSNYTPAERPGTPTDMFECAKRMGYECHLIWDSSWQKMVLRYGNCYGPETIIHNLEHIKQGVGCHYKHEGKLRQDENKAIDSIRKIINEVDGITRKTDKAFVWIHLPHVINGRTSYGGDIDVFDKLIGELRYFFDDEYIYISADHGNMNGYKGKWCYGFDVNTPSVEIPLITPRLEGLKKCDMITSNVDLKDLILKRNIKKREYVFSDTAYYAQPHRKLTIITEDFAYIYNKADKTEELYSLKYDRYERINLLETSNYDIDRKLKSPVSEYYFSPYWNEIDNIVSFFRCIKNEIWRNGSMSEEMRECVMKKLKTVAVKLKIFVK